MKRYYSVIIGTTVLRSGDRYTDSRAQQQTVGPTISQPTLIVVGSEAAREALTPASHSALGDSRHLALLLASCILRWNNASKFSSRVSILNFSSWQERMELKNSYSVKFYAKH